MAHMTNNNLSGVWRSRYKYPSSSRGGEFEYQHTIRLHQEGNRIAAESVPEEQQSYLALKLSLQDNVATGTWQEQTEKDGYYKGAVYYGAIQLILSEDGNRMSGKWTGFGKDGEVNTGSWELERIK